jgi:hypothetical protein
VTDRLVSGIYQQSAGVKARPVHLVAHRCSIFCRICRTVLTAILAKDAADNQA